MNRWMGVMGVVCVCAYAAAGARTAAEITEDSYAEGLRLFGESLAQALVETCERTPDNVLIDAKQARLSVLRNSTGEIGPVRYYQPVKAIESKSYEKIGQIEGYSPWVGPTESAVYGEKTKVRLKTMNWKVEYAPTFMQGFTQIERAAKSRHPEACAEVGATIFVDALKGRMGYSESKMASYFRTAAERGSRNGRYLYAFCLYYGIGCAANPAQARQALAAWSAEGSAGDAAWSRRRLAEEKGVRKGGK